MVVGRLQQWHRFSLKAFSAVALSWILVLKGFFSSKSFTLFAFSDDRTYSMFLRPLEVRRHVVHGVINQIVSLQ